MSVGLLLLAALVRVFIALGSYSGHNKPPLYGDFEAQRHWLEITVNLPISHWYKNSTDNDLNYWGLDYPPLTAYHSFFLGKIAQVVHPKMIELHISRGSNDSMTKLFMRAASLTMDCTLLFPAIVHLLNSLSSFSTWSFLAISSHPALVLIDSGHFQFNNVPLALSILSLSFLIRYQKNDRLFHLALSSILFSLALNYKQMVLLNAPFLFFYFLYLIRKSSAPLKSFCLVSLTTSLTFILVWFPFLFPNPSESVYVLQRIFPVSRGIFEERVANFWSTIAPVLDHFYFKKSLFFKLSAFISFISTLPFANSFSSINHLPLCAGLASLGPFLFGYQLHEKTALFFSLFISCYFYCNSFSKFFAPLFDLVVLSSMFTLLIRDGLGFQYFIFYFVFSFILFYNLCCSHFTKRIIFFSLIVYFLLTFFTFFYLFLLLQNLFLFVEFYFIELLFLIFLSIYVFGIFSTNFQNKTKFE
ncbi:hypothetical protein P9112_012954 [Eukaryota sp. TZLM1-RC]